MTTTDPTNGLPVTSDAAGQPTATPQPKVVAATTGAAVGGAAATVVLWVLQTYAHVDLPPLVQGAVLVLVSAFVSFVAGYLKRPSAAAS